MVNEKPRVPLSRHRIAEAAIAFVDTHGLAKLSMRKLGAELDVEAMSLYNHVENKEDLFDAIVESFVGEVLGSYQPDAESDWQDDAHALCSAWRTHALRHPNLIELITTRDAQGQLGTDLLLAAYRIFTKAGLSTKDAAIAFTTATSWLNGIVRQELGIMREFELKLPEPTSDIERELADFQAACLAWTPEQRFTSGLATLIAGVEHRFLPKG